MPLWFMVGIKDLCSLINTTFSDFEKFISKARVDQPFIFVLIVRLSVNKVNVDRHMCFICTGEHMTIIFFSVPSCDLF